MEAERADFVEAMRLVRAEMGQNTIESTEEEVLNLFLRDHRLNLTVYAYERSDALRPGAVIGLPLEVSLSPRGATTSASPSASPRSSSGPPSPRDGRAARDRRADGWRGPRHEPDGWPGPEPPAPPRADVMLRATVPRYAMRGLALNMRNLDEADGMVLVVGTRSILGAVVQIDRSPMVPLLEGAQSPGEMAGAVFDIRQLRGAGPREMESISWSVPRHAFLDGIWARLFQPEMIVVSLVAPALPVALPAEDLPIYDDSVVAPALPAVDLPIYDDVE